MVLYPNSVNMNVRFLKMKKQTNNITANRSLTIFSHFVCHQRGSIDNRRVGKIIRNFERFTNTNSND